MFAFVCELPVHHCEQTPDRHDLRKEILLSHNSGIRYSPSRQGRHAGWASLPIAVEGEATALHISADKQVRTANATCNHV